MGQAPSGDSYNMEGVGIPLIAGAGDFGDITPEPSKYTSSPTKISRPNEVILCIRATIGDRNWSNAKYCLGRGVAGLLGNEKKLDQNYLWHWLGHAAPELKSKGRGATFLQVSKADITSLQIPLPPIPEQRRIAVILDKADALRAKRREAIAKLDQLLQSVFLEMFGDPVTNPKGWPTRPFDEAVDLLTGYPFKSAEYTARGMKLCRGANIFPGDFNWNDTAYWPAGDAARFDRFRVQRDDILIAMDRPWISTGFKSVLVTSADSECLLVQRVARLRAKSHFRSDYLYRLFSSEAFKRHCRPTETTVPHISPKDFRTFPIIDPGKASIEKFAHIVGAQKKLAASFISSESGTAGLFSSLHQRAFTTAL